MRNPRNRILQVAVLALDPMGIGMDRYGSL